VERQVISGGGYEGYWLKRGRERRRITKGLFKWGKWGSMSPHVFGCR